MSSNDNEWPESPFDDGEALERATEIALRDIALAVVELSESHELEPVPRVDPALLLGLLRFASLALIKFHESRGQEYRAVIVLLKAHKALRASRAQSLGSEMAPFVQ